MAPMAKGSDKGFGREPSQRQLRVAEVLRRRLSDVLMRGEVHDPDLNSMSITVGEVTTSPDLKVATPMCCRLAAATGMRCWQR